MAFPDMFIGTISQSVKCITAVQSTHNMGTTNTWTHTLTHRETQLIFKSSDLESSWDEYYSIKN